MKFTYDVHIVTPRGPVPFVSGNLTQESFSGGKRHRDFSNQIPTPGYLIAIAAGDLEER